MWWGGAIARWMQQRGNAEAISLTQLPGIRDADG